jgi:bleomycin hydrolase
MTPIKDQGKSQTCWVYAMLATIETEHLSWGDSVNLSPYYIEKKMEQEPQCPETKRGMGKTLLNLIKKYGIVGYDDMQTVEISDEYIALTSNDDEPYYQDIDIDLPDNWMHDRFYNIPIDSLLAKTERAVRQHHGVCWESKGHAMAIVGIAHDEDGYPYFIMKNSWGTDRAYKGLDYLSFRRFRKETLAVEMTKEAYGLP